VAIFVRGVSKSELERIVQFIYQVIIFILKFDQKCCENEMLFQGEVNVSNEHLAEFLALADELKVSIKNR